ncbi:DUF2917 domain-containing protein [Caenimonas aquaedulcis]|uniref:DUF2917 domain-containing protein n=1 Tax=Caenimonas aquaedulcis TaxID=2793270 RepID=A0A931H1S2_9BURK|nr:DUF2917 domain-containing protein [Caenimonas aquaedulcis]MBG9386924.1 DUF2917 domain-containing protein [Caenimonas aquaedulcis]
MNATPATRHVPVARRGLLNIADAAGVQVRCEQGSVWLTLDNDPRDIVLEAGDAFHTDEHGLMLVYGLENSTVSVREPRRGLGQALRAMTRLSLQPA